MAQADLAITQSNGLTSVIPGQAVTYTITASNAGPSNAPAAIVADVFPTACATVSWTCASAGGGACAASGSGNLNETVNLPIGARVTYTAICTVSATAAGTLSNTASVAAPVGVADPLPGNNTSTDADTLVPISSLPKTDLVAGLEERPADGVDPRIQGGRNAVVEAPVEEPQHVRRGQGGSVEAQRRVETLDVPDHQRNARGGGHVAQSLALPDHRRERLLGQRRLGCEVRLEPGQRELHCPSPPTSDGTSSGTKP